MNHPAPRARTHCSAAAPRLFLFLFLLRFPSSCGAGEGRPRGAEAGLRGTASPRGPARRFLPKPPPHRLRWGWPRPERGGGAGGGGGRCRPCPALAGDAPWGSSRPSSQRGQKGLTSGGGWEGSGGGRSPPGRTERHCERRGRDGDGDRDGCRAEAGGGAGCAAARGAHVESRCCSVARGAPMRSPFNVGSHTAPSLPAGTRQCHLSAWRPLWSAPRAASAPTATRGGAAVPRPRTPPRRCRGEHKPDGPTVPCAHPRGLTAPRGPSRWALPRGHLSDGTDVLTATSVSTALPHSPDSATASAGMGTGMGTAHFHDGHGTQWGCGRAVCSPHCPELLLHPHPMLLPPPAAALQPHPSLVLLPPGHLQPYTGLGTMGSSGMGAQHHPHGQETAVSAGRGRVTSPCKRAPRTPWTL